MAKKDSEETAVVEVEEAKSLNDADTYALLDLARLQLEQMQGTSQGKLPRLYGQVLTMLGSTMTRYKNDVIEANKDELSKPAPHK